MFQISNLSHWYTGHLQQPTSADPNNNTIVTINKNKRRQESVAESGKKILPYRYNCFWCKILSKLFSAYNRCQSNIGATVVSIILILCSIQSASGLQKIPGCYDIEQIDELINFNETSLQNLLLCFCKIDAESNVAINCVYGSTLHDLDKAIALVNNVNGTIKEISLSHMDFTETMLIENIFNKTGLALRRLFIGSCSQDSQLAVNDGAFNGLEATLQQLTLTECNIEEFPKAISNLENLETLSLAHNRLVKIPKDAIKKLKKLKKLNIEGNFIASLDEGTLDPIAETLETLSLGEHNFINETMLNEIKKLKNLKVLDLSKADGVTNFPNGTFENLGRLEKLLLTGCNIASIDENTFDGLTGLKQLDLRVNLIRHVKCGSFKKTPNLQKLSLAGNFLNKTENCTWEGLEKIVELDLAWNEFQTVEDTLTSVGSTLKVLDYRHNTNLNEIDINAFKELKVLEIVNLSDTAIAHITTDTFKFLKSLKAIDLTHSELEAIEPHSFQNQNESLEELIIGSTRLRRISAEVFDELNKLKKLDLSGNKWICDSKLKPVIEAIKRKYEDAARIGKEFVLENSNETVCDRPYIQRGEIITSLDESILKDYDVRLDTTTTTPKPTTTAKSEVEEETLTTFSLIPEEIVIGEENKTKQVGHEQKATRPPPAYEINSSRPLGEKPEKGHALATIITLVALTGITAAITIAVAFYLKKKRDMVATADTEMNVRCRKEEHEKEIAVSQKQ